MLRYLFGLVWLLFLGSISKTQVSEDLVLGRTGPDCAGRGICGFSRAGSTTANALLQYTPADSLLTASIIREKLSSNDMLKQFGTKNTKAILPPSVSFVVEADYIISQELKTDLNIPIGITSIASGYYAITQTQDLIIVSFKLQ